MVVYLVSSMTRRAAMLCVAQLDVVSMVYTDAFGLQSKAFTDDFGLVWIQG